MDTSMALRHDNYKFMTSMFHRIFNVTINITKQADYEFNVTMLVKLLQYQNAIIKALNILVRDQLI